MLLILSLVFFIIHLWFRYKLSFWKRLGFPSGPSFPLRGSKFQHFDFIRKTYRKIGNKGPAFGVYFLTKPVLLPTDPDLIREILVKSFDAFEQRGMKLHEDADPISPLIFTDYQKWKIIKAKITPILSSAKTKQMIPAMVDKCDRMVNFMTKFADNSEIVEMKEIFCATSTEVFFDVAFGLNVEVLGDSDNDFTKIQKKFFEPSPVQSLKMLFVMSFKKLSYHLKLAINNKETIEFFTGLMKKAVELREKSDVDRNDLLEVLIGMKESGILTTNEFHSLCFGLFLAG